MNPGHINRPGRMGGFTLIEIMVVIVIIGLIVGIVAPGIMGQLGRAETTVAEADLRSIGTALDFFYIDHHRYPTGDEGLEVLLGNAEIEGRQVAEFLNSLPEDPWGRAYHYEYPSSHGDDFDVYTFGADGKEGGEDTDADIGTWNLD